MEEETGEKIETETKKDEGTFQVDRLTFQHLQNVPCGCSGEDRAEYSLGTSELVEFSLGDV